MNYQDLIILYEDNQLIVVLKPQNEPCCPDESNDTSLLDCVREYIRVTYNKPGNAFVGLVHRLDRPTGGVMVFAKNSKIADKLCSAIREGGFEKRYLAVLCGAPRKDRAVLENYLRKNAINNMVYACTQTEEGAKFASLDYEIKQKKDGLSLVEVNLHTGRSHQIRVQFASINTPLYGDMRYGGEKAQKGKLALWAYSLKFTHPKTQEVMRFIALPPEEGVWKGFDVNAVVDKL